MICLYAFIWLFVILFQQSKQNVNSRSDRLNISCHYNMIYTTHSPLREVSIPKGVNAFDYCSRANVLATGGVDKVIRVWHPHIFSRPTGEWRPRVYGSNEEPEATVYNHNHCQPFRIGTYCFHHSRNFLSSFFSHKRIIYF